MKFLLFFLVLVFISFTRAFAFDVTLLRNNKESYSRMVTRDDRRDLAAWTQRHRLGEQLVPIAAQVFRATMITYAAREVQCDVGLPALLIRNAMNAGVLEQEDELRQLLVLLRENDEMDDILMGVFIDAEEVRFDLANASRWKRPKTPRNLLPAPEGLDVKKYFSFVANWPDDQNFCSIGRYFRMAEMLRYKSSKERDGLLWRMAHIGLRDGHIDTETFHRLDALSRDHVLDWDHYASTYVSMITNAKDKMAKVREVVNTNGFTEKYVSRKEGLTRRGRLYKTFSPTQVMIMSGVIEKLARRLDARRVELIFQYGPNADESQSYVLSPMEQYRVSIKMMRKEMAELMRGDLFAGTGLEYEDIIAASFETGLIKSSELDQILKFEEFWNPRTNRIRAYASFAFSLAGTATFYLPPPWNIVGAVALMFTQTRIMPAPQPDSDDNWNVII